jgi:hypothetical protein
VQDSNVAALTHQITCRDIANGREISQIPLVRGPIYLVGAAGDRIIYQHYQRGNASLLSVRNQFPSYNHGGSLADVQTGQIVAGWRIDTQWVLPKADADFVSAVSSNGELVAVGGSGALRVYRVSR